MFKLNKDILFSILEELKDDSKSLFSCLMVNKLWCETGIPILWRNPWNYSINYSNKEYLFTMIVSYLSNEIKEFLTREGIQFPSIDSFQIPYVDYLSFCRGININAINKMISIGSSLDYNQFLLQQEFYSLFMKKFPKLKYLDMRSLKHQIFYFPEANIRLKSLCELKCDTSMNSSCFYGLARNCQYIQKLIIVNVKPKANNGISKLIQVQKNLKCFVWIDDFDDEYFTDPYNEIFLELGNKADTLNHLDLFFLYFYGFDYPYTSLQILLPKLHQLKTLITNEFSYDNDDILKTFIYNNLEILNIGYITIYEASVIIENSGGHLKEISLKPYDFVYSDDNFIKDSLNFICKIHENCPLIEYLSLAFSPSKCHFIEFEKLLKNCQNLKLLLLITSNFNTNETEEEILENGKILLNILTRSAPPNFNELRFFEDFKFSLYALEEFLENWRGRPALTIITSNYFYEEENYQELINKYKNDGVIKNFKYEYSVNVEDLNFKVSV
ncbi:hypothetical protein RclHR1_00040032 [Rhizophagus clarus]|uniref:F-box domain-containing protein n=1 Tax=Rhizophagus clarus TaxID=94130 RepID=A0A2Z6RG28_9GLOM|nr:hypothetical protein RclHR1_00040032 [Rhizophagus clarus]GES91731.1 hypothetical protein GLOIN_2v1764020 [Rhizophagus clarus]